MNRPKSLPFCDNVYWISAEAARQGGGWRSFRAGRHLKWRRRSQSAGAACFAFAGAVTEELEILLLNRLPMALFLALLGGFASASLLLLLFPA